MLTNERPTAEHPAAPGPEHSADAGLAVDWRAVRLTERSCCCLSQPAVVAVLPPPAGRPHPTELLLCGHHYRRSRRALAAMDARVMDPNGTPVPPQQIWVGQ